MYYSTILDTLIFVKRLHNDTLIDIALKVRTRKRCRFNFMLNNFIDTPFHW